MMTFNYESKNRIVKNYAYVCKQRKNLAKSLSYKSAMRFNSLIRVYQNGFLKSTYHERATETNFESFSAKRYFKNINFSISFDQEIYICTKIFHKKTTYEKGFYIVDNIINPTKLWKIYEIVILSDEYYFILENFCIEKYVKHLRSYKVGESINTFDIINVNCVKSLPFNLQKISNGEFYFRVKQI